MYYSIIFLNPHSSATLNVAITFRLVILVIQIMRYCSDVARILEGGGPNQNKLHFVLPDECNKNTNKNYNLNIFNVKPIKNITSMDIFQQYNGRNTFGHNHILHESLIENQRSNWGGGYAKGRSSPTCVIFFPYPYYFFLLGRRDGTN